MEIGNGETGNGNGVGPQEVIDIRRIIIDSAP
jgi:hypothetical protein